MNDLVAWLVDPSGLTAHGFCLLWQPGLIWAHAGADLVIGLTYFAMSAGLLRVAGRSQGLMFMPLIWMFAAFIALCGLSHWFDVLTLWLPAYGAQAVVKVLTALASSVTAVALWCVIPKALAMPSPEVHRGMVEALRKSETFLDRVGRVAGVGGWELDLLTGTLHFSALTYEIHGLQPGAQLSVEEAINFYAPEGRPIIRAAVEKGSRDGSGWDLRLPFIRADGTRLWVRASGVVQLQDGKPVRVTGAFQDVTAGVLQEMELQAAEERVRLAADGAGIGVWDRDIATGKLVWSEGMFRVFGCYPMGEAIDHDYFVKRLHPDDRARVEAVLMQTFEHDSSYRNEFRVVWDDGSVHHLRSQGTVLRDAAGRPTRMIGVSWDVTEARELAVERDRQAAQLATSEERFRLIAENANDVVSLVDRGGVRSYASPAAEQLFGVSPEAFMARPVSEFIHPDDRQTVTSLQAELLAGTTEQGAAIFRALHPLRGEVWIEVNARCLRDPADGRSTGYVSVLRDVTDRMAVEAELRAKNAALDQLARHFEQAKANAERANRAKTRFLAGISHELRTPLNGILGYAQLLRRTEGLTERQMEWVGRMLTAGTHLLEMISGVLDLSEIESDTLELQVAAVDVRGLVQACVDMVRPTAETKALALSLSVSADVPDRIAADPKRLRQVILNLVGNAVKYTPSGAVGVAVTTTDGACLRVEVIDTGTGIKPDSRGLLFKDYQRLDVETVNEAEGSGLGLSLAKKLTDLMQGTIGHADNPGGGSIFWVEIPLAMAAATEPSAIVMPVSLSDPEKSSPRRVLIVDDVPMNLEIASAFAQSAGYCAVCVESGEKAIDAASSENFDVILMDVRMPGIDGLEATRRIRQLEGPRGMVPIVALTAQAFTEQISDCRVAGMNTHLVKPFTPESLSAAIERAMQTDRSCPTALEVPATPDAPAFGGDCAILRDETVEMEQTVLPHHAVVSDLRELADSTTAL